MTVEEVKKIDFIGTDKETDNIILTISDHLQWDNEHIYILQEKINSYLAFIETGQIYEDYPKSKGKKIVIEIIAKYPFNDEAIEFLEKVKPVVEGAGFGFNYKILEK
jgi:hypothetical protein